MKIEETVGKYAQAIMDREAELARVSAELGRLRAACERLYPHLSHGEPYGAERHSEHRMAMRNLELAMGKP